MFTTIKTNVFMNKNVYRMKTVAIDKPKIHL